MNQLAEPENYELNLTEPVSEALDTIDADIPFGQFILVALSQLAAILVVFWLIAPHVMRAELTHGWALFGWTIAFGIPLSLFEYLYHRYLLHSAVLPFLGIMHHCHTKHHGLTNVQAPVKAQSPENLATVKSSYPVEEKHQEESMMFPLFSLLIFIPVLMILFALPVKLIFPSQPILLALILSVTLYYCGYELWHGLLHLSYETFWQPKMKHSTVKHVYGFHLMHHWRPSANLAIVGFWGFALWDHAFRTHHRPDRMPLHDAQVSYADGKLTLPRWPISLLDRWQGPWARTSRILERAFFGLFSKKTKGD